MSNRPKPGNALNELVSYSFHCWGKSGPRSPGPVSKARPPTFCSTDFMSRKTRARMLVARRPPAVRWESHEGRSTRISIRAAIVRLLCKRESAIHRQHGASDTHCLGRAEKQYTGGN